MAQDPQALEKTLVTEREHWLGEIEGIDLTLTYLRTKRHEAQRLTHRPPVQLGIPQARGDDGL